ncbi:MAG TPA: dihydrodipicolinate synthase family protein [Firmicutes bacterium]|nr:dihydrodipicolinate synthase family protein [Bacillota bacterium]
MNDYVALRERMDNGIHPILMTPFQGQDQHVEVGPLKEHIDFLFAKAGDNAIAGFLVAGANGEVYAMTPRERTEVIRAAVEQVRGRAPVVGGAVEPATDLTILRVSEVHDAGADCAMITNPFYCSPDEAGVLAHYRKIFELVDGFPLMIYNNPVYTNFSMPLEMMVELTSYENFVAMKDVPSSGQEFYTRCKSLKGKVAYINNMGGELHFGWSSFVTGCTSCFSNVVLYAPEPVFSLYRAVRANDLGGIKAALEWLQPLHSLYHKFCPYLESWRTGGGSKFLSIVKEGLRWRGFDFGNCRLPVLPLSEEEKGELHRVLSSMGLPR